MGPRKEGDLFKGPETRKKPRRSYGATLSSTRAD